MKVKQLKQIIKTLPDNADFLVSSDEELNNLFQDIEVVLVSDFKNPTYAILGLTGSDVEPE